LHARDQEFALRRALFHITNCKPLRMQTENTFSGVPENEERKKRPPMVVEGRT